MSGTVAEGASNDTLDTATALSIGETATGAIGLLPDDSRIGVFFNDELSGKVVITWNKLAKFPGIGLNTVQAVLFQDGTIQFADGGVVSNRAIGGISPSTGAGLAEVNYRAGAFSTTSAAAIYQGLFITGGKTALARQVITFVLNDDGYDVSHFE